MDAHLFPTRLLHTMLRVGDLERAIAFYTETLGMKLLRQKDYPDGKFTLAFLGHGKEAETTVLELTYNWGVAHYEHGAAYGHIALAVADIYKTCAALAADGVKVTRPPCPMKDGGASLIAFIEDPDGYKIELIQRA